MDDSQKQSILSRARQTLAAKVDKFIRQRELFTMKMEELRKLAPQLMEQERDKVDPGTEEGRLLFAKADIREAQAQILTELIDSPYFTRCEVEFADQPGEIKELFFSKHTWTPEQIYSWISPVSTIRFEEPGDFEFELPDGKTRKGNLKTKESYIITRSEIAYLTNETQEHAKQLIYQKHLSERKQFALPEIVAELEKAQDQIIRSKPEGGLLVTGSAGSGKTTLALHRIAYLAYSPEFDSFFEPERIMVFVTDHNAIEYFSKLLPDLGISGVRITTFADWAIEVVNGLQKLKFKPLYLDNAVGQISSQSHSQTPARLIYDEFRKVKLAALEIIDKDTVTVKSLFETYRDLGHSKFGKLFNDFLDFQLNFQRLDEIDMTMLLLPFDRPIKSFKHIVVDEVQNWLAPQLDLIQRIVEPQYKSITYIGDVKQRTKAFTIRDWEELSAGYPLQTKITLSKVYRNTQQVLAYLSSLGYPVYAQETTKTGNEVAVHEFKSKTQQEHFISQKLLEHVDQKELRQVGVLSRFDTSLEAFREIGLPQNFHLLTVEAAQGLEFDTVYMVDTQDFWEPISYYQATIGYANAEEYLAVSKQLFYVGATRAEAKLIISKVSH
jgi:DNA helicase IV